MHNSSYKPTQFMFNSHVFQVEILEEGLLVHGRLAPDEVQPLHQRLVERISQLKQSLKKPAIPSVMDSIQKYVDENYENSSSDKYVAVIKYFV